MLKCKRGILMLLVVLLVVPVGAMAQKKQSSKIPVINSISPTSTYAGGADFTLTVTGSNFTNGSVAQWNGGTRTTTVVSSSQLQAQISSADVASAGTAKVTVYTSGRFGGTSFSALSFTINPAPTASTTTTTTSTPPTTTTAALAITTTSVPPGTTGTAYSASLAASGGTQPYTWGTASGGGGAPPGLALTAAGAITGTPTTAGTTSLTAQATDTAGQVAQKAFSLAIAAPPTTTTTSTTSTTPLFQTGFEDGLPGPWGAVNSSPAVSITAPPPGRSGNALQLHYSICGATDGTCGGSSQDHNRWVSKVINPGLTHFFMRGYVYFKSPEPDATTPPTTYAQRKVLWFSDSTSAGNSQVNYANFLNSWTAVGRSTLSLAFGGNNVAGCAGPIPTLWDMAFLNWDTWYSLEIEIQQNSPGVLDGIIRLWVNGVKTYEKTNVNLQGTCPDPIAFFSVGRQTNRYNYDAIDEYRYWDDVVISSSYIGP